MLVTHAAAMKYIGLLLSPRPRKMELVMLYAVINGMPIKQTVRYRTVPSTASAGVDIMPTIGRTRMSKSAASPTDSAINSVTVLPTASDAFFRSPPPTACPMVTVVPMARPTSITVSICITCEPMETAVVSATPLNCPTMNRSAMP